MNRKHLAYWLITGIVAAECLIGGVYDLFRLPPFYPALIELGYPAYLATILGLAKISAAVVVLAPRLPRLKEWAYAGILINMVGAAASLLLAGMGWTTIIAPLSFAGLALASWALRPASRRI